MKKNTWQTLFTQIIKLAEAKKPESPPTEETKTLAQQWENIHSELEQGPLAEDYYAYYENTQQDTREPEIDLIAQQEWYDKLQLVQLFVQDVLHKGS